LLAEAAGLFPELGKRTGRRMTGLRWEVSPMLVLVDKVRGRHTVL
jgi:hypothetical protein